MALLEANPLPAAIDRPSHSTTVVLGDGDEEAPAENVTGWPHGAVELIEVGGDHLVPLRHAGLVAQLVGERIPPR